MMTLFILRWNFALCHFHYEVQNFIVSAHPAPLPLLHEVQNSIVRFGTLLSGSGHYCRCTTITYSNHEDTPAMGVKRGCFKVELQPVQILVAQTPEIDAPARHEVLFDGANSVVLIW